MLGGQAPRASSLALSKGSSAWFVLERDLSRTVLLSCAAFRASWVKVGNRDGTSPSEVCIHRAGHGSVSRLTLRVSRCSDMLSVSCRQTLPQLTNFELRHGKTIELRVSEFNKFNDGVARPGKTPKGCSNYVLDKAIVSLIMTATRKSTCCALPPPTDQRRALIKPFVRGNLEYSH